MITYGLQVNQGSVDSLFRKLDRLDATRVLRVPMEESLQLLQDDLTDYPPPSKGKMVFKTTKQRRYFFWALKQGVIQVPYVRTGKLGQSWTYKITVTGSGLCGVVGTNLRYAQVVQAEDSQARIHRGNWPTDAQVVHRRRDEIGQRFRIAIKRALAAAGGGG